MSKQFCECCGRPTKSVYHICVACLEAEQAAIDERDYDGYSYEELDGHFHNDPSPYDGTYSEE